MVVALVLNKRVPIIEHDAVVVVYDSIKQHRDV